MVGRLQDQANPPCSEQLRSDFGTRPGFGTCCLHGGATQQGPFCLSSQRPLSVLTSGHRQSPTLPVPKPPSQALETKVFLGLDFMPSFPDIFFNSHTHAHTFLSNEHDEGERKKGEESKRTDRSYLLSQVSLLLRFMGLWFWSLSPILTFKLPITGGKGGEKRAASLSLCLNLLFTWKCVRLTQTSLTCQRAAAGRGVFDL